MTGTAADPYKDPAGDFLRNKVGLRSPEALKAFEYEQTEIRTVELRENPIPGRFDLAHMRAIHKALFQDVYDWAGETRSINISKGGTSFTKASHLDTIGERLAENLAKDKYLQGQPKDKFVDRLAHHYAEWNALHPFREGNGRATREFIGQLARGAGYELDQTRIDKVKGEWNLAAKLSFQGELGPIKDLFAEAVRPLRAIAFDKLPEAEAVAQHPELRASYDGLRAMKANLAQRFPANDKAQSHYLAQARTEVLRKLDSGQVLEPVQQRSQAAPTKAPAREPIGVPTRSAGIER